MKKEKALQELLEVLDPYVLLTFKGTKKEKKTPQERPEVLDPYILLTFKGTKEKRKNTPGAAGGAGSLCPPYF